VTRTRDGGAQQQIIDAADLLNEFYPAAFRKKTYESIDELRGARGSGWE
jgi:hypothetical protein